jgi:Flp pilus assembly protein CpaB
MVGRLLREGVSMKSVYRLFVVMVLVLVFSAPVWAQSTQANISGKVTDEAKKPIRDVLVTATNTTTGAKQTRTSDKRGKFRFMSVNPGAYKLLFEKEGFEPHVVMCVMSAEESVGIKAVLKKKEAPPSAG